MAAPTHVDARSPILPLEVLLLIVENLAPTNQRAILAPSNESTRTLLSLTRVCSTLYLPAVRLLRRHCAYIDSRGRAETFVRCLSCSPPAFMKSSLQVGNGLRDIENLFLAPFPEKHDSYDPEGEKSRLHPEHLDSWTGWRESDAESQASMFAEGSSTDNSDNLEDANAEAQEPIPDTSDSGDPDTLSFWGPRPPPLDNLTIATVVRGIFISVAPTLKRLVVDMPLRSLYPDDDGKGVRPTLRRGFKALRNLEECVSVRDELYLDISPVSAGHDRLVWGSHWPKLRRLAIYNPELSHNGGIWRCMARLPNFEMCVFTRADGMFDFPNEEDAMDFKRVWTKEVAAAMGRTIKEVERAPKPLTFVHMNERGFEIDWTSLSAGWRGIDPDNRVQLLQAMINRIAETEHLVDKDGEYEESPISLCQNTVLNLALQGKLWDIASVDVEDAVHSNVELLTT